MLDFKSSYITSPNQSLHETEKIFEWAVNTVSPIFEHYGVGMGVGCISDHSVGSRTCLEENIFRDPVYYWQ